MIKSTTILAIIALLTLLVAACGSDGPGELVVLTNDSFDIGEEIIAQFEEDNNATVIIQKAGSSGEVLNRAILEKGNPSGDLLYGVDNTFLSRALRECVFYSKQFPGEPYPRSTVVPNKSSDLPNGTLAAILGGRQTGLGRNGLQALIDQR